MIRNLLIAIATLLASSEALPDTSITGFYSNMRVGTEDVSGVEVFITYSDHGFFAYVQCAEGAISQPILVPVSKSLSVIEFVVPVPNEKNSYACPSGKFKGVMSSKGLSGYFEGTDWPGFLMRKGSYWQ